MGQYTERSDILSNPEGFPEALGSEGVMEENGEGSLSSSTNKREKSTAERSN